MSAAGVPWENQIFATIDDLLGWLAHERPQWQHGTEGVILDRILDWALKLRPARNELSDISLVFLSPTAVHVTYAWGPGIASQREEIIYAQ